MNKLLIGILSAAILLPAGYSLASGLDSSSDEATFAAGTTTGRTTARTTTGRTTTVGTTTDRGRRGEKARGDRKRGRSDRIRRREPGEDVRGPCDEAENRNDPRCTGPPARDDDDNSGPGRRGDRGDDNNSGHGRGRGSDD